MNTNKVSKHRVINIDYEKNKVSWVYYIPLLLIAGFVPLIVYGKYVDLTGTTQALYWTGQNINLDFFSFWKSRWVIFLTATALVIYIFLFISKKLPFKKEYKYYIPLGVYAIFVILSTIFAIDVPTALNGFMDMYQGMWVLLSYVLLTFLTINFVNSERDVKLFLYAFGFLIIVEGLLGIGQYFGFDIFNTKFGNSMIIPSGVNVDGGLTFNFGKHTIYGTLFNTNYVGSFATLMLPMAVVFLISAKTTKRRVAASIALILCLFAWIGCNSRAGYVGIVVVLLFSSIVFWKYVLRYKKVFLCTSTIVIVLLIGLNFVTNGTVINRLFSLNVFEEIDKLREQDKREDILVFKDMYIDNDIVCIKTNLQDLIIKVDGDKLFFLDENNVTIPMKTNDNNRLVMDNGEPIYFEVSITENYPGFNIYIPWFSNNSLNFYILENEIKLISGSGKIGDLQNPKTIEFLNGLEYLASGRGFIWGRTIPMLKDNFIVGSGPDNFTYVFPQNDLVGKVRAGMFGNVVVDKPHNMYLQIAINTGVLSLLSLVILWIIYIISSIKLYWKINLDSVYKYMGLGCLLSVIGYLAAGMFNDHIVSVAPLFWVILGLGISINIRLKGKEKDNV